MAISRRHKNGVLGALGRGIASALGNLLHKDEPSDSKTQEAFREALTQEALAEPSEYEVNDVLDAISNASDTEEADDPTVSASSQDIENETGGVPQAPNASAGLEAPGGETDSVLEAPRVPRSVKHLVSVDDLALEDLGISHHVQASLEQFGLYTVTELLLYRREELVELHGINQATLSIIEKKVEARTGEPFHLPGSIKTGPTPRRLRRDEMVALDRKLSDLKVSPLVAKQLRKNYISGCRQIAFASRDELLDHPGIDLETTYELEEALGALLGTRIVLGCDRGEPPTVVDSEPPYDWRLQKSASEEEMAEGNDKNEQTDKPEIIGSDEPEGEPRNESVGEDPSSLESPENGDVTIDGPSDSPRPNLSQGPYHAGAADEAENHQPAIVKESPAEVFNKSDNSSSDDEWDDASDWDDNESEWDDASKWDWMYGEAHAHEAESSKAETPDYRAAIGIAQWASSQDDVSAKLLLCLLDGMTHTQAASENKVPASSVASLVAYGLSRRPLVREDEYAYAFKSYAMTLYEFIDIFGQPASTYRYLSLAYESGGGSLLSMLDDPDISDMAKANLRHRLASRVTLTKEPDRGSASYAPGSTTIAPTIDTDHASKVIAKTDVSLLDDAVVIDSTLSIHQAEDEDEGGGEDDELEVLRSAISRLGVDGKEYATSFFYHNMPKLMADLGIESVDEADAALRMAFFGDPDVEFPSDGIVRFGTANHDRQIESLLEGMSPVSFGDLAWQYRALYGVESDILDRWLTKFERYRHGDSYDIRQERPAHELCKRPQRLPSGNSPRARLARAVMDLAEDGTEYSTNYFLHSLPGLAKELRASSGSQFNQVMRQTFEGSDYVTFPSGYFVHFGKCDREQQIYNLMRELSPVTVQELRREYSKRYGVSMTSLYSGWFACINKYMRGGIYSVEDDSDAAASVIPVQDIVATNTEAMPRRGQNAMGPDALRRLREAIDKIAKDDTEYSTDFFYAELGNLVDDLGIDDGAGFYDMVVEAYRSSDYVTFPQGKVTRAVWFGDCKRDAQLLGLIEELSPATLDELANEYEKRYGFSSYLVKWWYRKFEDYESGGVYRIEASSASESSERGVGTLEGPTGVDTGDDVAHNDNPSPSYSESAGEAEVRATQESAGAEKPERQSRQLSDRDSGRTAAPSESKRPKTALEWALGLEGLQRQVVQQILFGYTLPMVAGNAGLSLEETGKLLVSTIGRCPTVQEDSLLFHFRLSKSMQDFCRRTGESEATYYFLSWRSEARGQHAPGTTANNEGARSLEHGESRTGTSTAERRRQMRAAARTKEKAWQSGRVNDDVHGGQGQGEEQEQPISNESTARGTAFEGKPIRLTLGPAAERRVVREVDHIATMGREYSPAYFYGSLLPTMRELGINSDDELLDVLRHAYRRDPDVSFVEGSVIRFGKCDRRKQLESFLAEDPEATLDSFVSGYKGKYGFNRMRVARWLKEYGINLPASQPVNDLASSLVNDLLANDSTDATAEQRSQTNEPLQTKRQQLSFHQTQKELTMPTKRTGRVSQTTEYVAFLRGELAADCCDRRLIVERFRAKFPDGPEDPFSEEMLRRLGFTAKGKKLLFREGIRYEEYFESLIDSKKVFARGDVGFENAIFNDPQFRKILRRKMRSFAVVEYEKDSFISRAYLCEQMGVTLEDIKGYSQDVAAQLRERIGAPAPFTIWSLRNQYGIRHPLDVLKTEGGMSDFVFETLFDIDPHVQCCTISGKRGFLETDGDFDTGNFIECLIELNGPMDFDDLIDLLRDAYGIDYPELPLHHVISASSLYYDDITEIVFNSRREWEEMVNRELA